MYADLRQIACKMLPSSDVERNSGPTPVLNLKSYCCVSFRYGAGVHAWLLPIARYLFAINHARTILPPSGEPCYVINTHPMKGDVKEKRFSPPLRKMRVW